MKRSSIVLRPQVTPFVVLFVERAGSTYLITALKSHPGILAVTEKLESLRRDGLGAAAQLEWAAQFLTPPLIGRHSAIGFKTKLVDVLDRDGFATLLRERQCHVIQLQRRNTVKAVISTINARRQWEVSGNWNLLSESTRLPAFEVNPDQFDQLLRERARLDRDLMDYVDNLRLPTLRLFYEDLLQDEQGFLDRTLTFLTGRRRTLRGATLKNTGDDLRGAIVNFDQLRHLYTGTPYEPMFDEVLLTT
jgi:LPS sulfotransferase NodH